MPFNQPVPKKQRMLQIQEVNNEKDFKFLLQQF
jgi:hypothetical protein